MQAAIFHGDRRITVAGIERPVPGAGEVLLRVRRTALCGSDTKLRIKGAQVTPGHEIFGVVDQPGHPRDGERCLVYIPVHCGHCDSCVAGDTQMCLNESVLGDRAATRRADADRRKRKPVAGPGSQGDPSQGLLHGPHLLFSEERLRPQCRTVAQGKKRYRQLVDAQFGIEQLPEMFGRFAAGELVKPLLAFA